MGIYVLNIITKNDCSNLIFFVLYTSNKYLKSNSFFSTFYGFRNWIASGPVLNNKSIILKLSINPNFGSNTC